MAKKLLSVCAIIICSACGLEDVDSASKFISKTQGDPSRYPSTSTGREHVIGGKHANAYLINKVHTADHSCALPRNNCTHNPYTGFDGNLTITVKVGYWDHDGDGCCNSYAKDENDVNLIQDPGSCTCDAPGAPNTPPILCLNNATGEVEKAFTKWLKPLADRYSDIVVQPFGGKDTSDMLATFACNNPASNPASTPASKGQNDCPCSDEITQITPGEIRTSCIRYYNSPIDTALDNLHPDELDSLEWANIGDYPQLRKINRPHIYICDGNVPASINQDKIGPHDKLDLMHEIGHAFGLADTHIAGDAKTREVKQPRSLMSRDRIGKRNNPEIQLGRDDIVGIQWLYDHHRISGVKDHCLFPDEYEHESYDPNEGDSDRADEGCVPKFPLIYALKTRNPFDALLIIGRENIRGERVGTDPYLEINIKEPSTGRTALHYAVDYYAYNGNTQEEKADYLEVISRIIKYPGVNLNLQDKQGETPLHIATRLDLQDIVIKLLAERSIFLLVRDNLGDTPLHSAARAGNDRMIGTLNADFARYVGEKNDEGKTALHLAAQFGHDQAVQGLLNYAGIGSLFTTGDSSGNNALHLAAQFGRTTVVSLLLNNDATLLNYENNSRETALHLAAKHAHDKTVAELLRQTGIEVNKQNSQGNTPLHLAAKSTNGTAAATVTLLLNKNGIDTTITNNNNLTARDEALINPTQREAIIAVFDGGDTRYGTSSAQRLLQALKVGNVDPATYCGASDTECRQNSALSIIRADQNLDVNYVDTATGNTALHYAAQGDDPTSNTRGPYELVVDLLTRRTLINPNITNTNGSAPLHLAVQYDKLEVVKLLLRNRQLNVNLANNIGETALHIAVDLEYEDIVAELLRYRLGSIDVNLQNNAGQAPLHVAAEQRSPAITQMLVDDRRVDVNLRTRNTDETALHIAAEYNNDEVVRTLLSDADVDVNIQDSTGSTALHIAAHHGSEQVVTILLDVTDSDLTILDNQQLSAYGRAEANGQTRIVDIFDNQNKGDDIVFRGTLMEELRDKKANEDMEDVALDILSDNEDDLDVNEKDSRSGKTPLHYAIEYEYERLITKLLARSDLQANLKDKEGETPLITAVRLKQTKTITALLRHPSIKINETKGNGDTALLIAVRAQAQPVITLLVGHNSIDANRKDRAGNTPMHLAVNSKNSTIVGALLNATGIDVNLKDSRGNTALHSAVSGNETPIVNQLVAVLSIDANRKNNVGDTPLHLAANSKNSTFVRALLTIATLDVNLKDSDSKTALHIAVDNNDEATVTQLLSNRNIDVNMVVTGITGQTALNIAIAQHIATNKNYGKVIDLLLAHLDIDVNVKNRHQESPLLVVVKEEETALVTKLLAHTDTEVNTSNSRHKTALMFAAERGSTAIVQQLLAHNNIDVNLQDDKQFTALHYAAHQGRVEIVRLLLAHTSINTAFKDKWRLTARDRAKTRGHTKVVAVFNEYEAGDIGSAITLLTELDRGDSEDSLMAIIDANQGNIAINAKDDDNDYTALHYAAKLGYTRVVNALLDYDSIKVNEYSTRKERPLHLAARRGHAQVVRALLAHKSIEVNVRDNREITPLHRAVTSGNNDTVQALLGHTDIRPTRSTGSGYTALHWATQLGYERIVRALLNKKASLINMKTDDQRTALYYAAWFGHKAVVQELLRQHDVNTNLRDTEGDTALHKAAAYNRLEIARLILDAGTSTQISNKQRQKARDIAQDKGYTDMVELIDSY